MVGTGGFGLLKITLVLCILLIIVVPATPYGGTVVRNTGKSSPSSLDRTIVPFANPPPISFSVGVGVFTSDPNAANNHGVNTSITLPPSFAQPANGCIQYSGFSECVFAGVSESINATMTASVGVLIAAIGGNAFAIAVAFLPNGTVITTFPGDQLTFGQTYNFSLTHSTGKWWNFEYNGLLVRGTTAWENGTFNLNQSVAAGFGTSNLGGLPVSGGPMQVMAELGNSSFTFPQMSVPWAIGIQRPGENWPSYRPIDGNARLWNASYPLGIEGQDQNSSLVKDAVVEAGSTPFPGVAAPLWGYDNLLGVFTPQLAAYTTETAIAGNGGIGFNITMPSTSLSHGQQEFAGVQMPVNSTTQVGVGVEFEGTSAVPYYFVNASNSESIYVSDTQVLLAGSSILFEAEAHANGWWSFTENGAAIVSATGNGSVYLRQSTASAFTGTSYKPSTVTFSSSTFPLLGLYGNGSVNLLNVTSALLFSEPNRGWILADYASGWCWNATLQGLGEVCNSGSSSPGIEGNGQYYQLSRGDVLLGDAVAYKMLTEGSVVWPGIMSLNLTASPSTVVSGQNATIIANVSSPLAFPPAFSISGCALGKCNLGFAVSSYGTYWTLFTASYQAPATVSTIMVNISVTAIGNPNFLTAYNMTVLTVTPATKTYTETFSETGLPVATGWSVTLGGTLHTSATSEITFAEANGTYSWVLTKIPGYHADAYYGNVTVSGANVSIPVSWSQVTYEVAFTEYGLPMGGPWWVNITGGASDFSVIPTLSFSEPNGTYNFSVATVLKDFQSRGGSFKVSGTALSKTVVFALIEYNGTFVEEGLPSGTTWSVLLDSILHSSVTNTISFAGSNGTYQWTLTAIAGYHASVYSGNVTISGANVSVPISWSQVTYQVTLTEYGLPSGTEWWINFSGGPSVASYSTGLLTREPNGTYAYSIATVNREYSAPGGSFTINGTRFSMNLTFILLTYPVTFTETGLPSGTTWYLNVTGQSPLASTITTTIIDVPNGTYSYSVETSDKDYAPSPASSSFSVSGAPLSKGVTFSLVTYTVTFTETGIRSGLEWYLNVTGEPPVPSTSTTTSLSLPNGTYSYSIATDHKQYEPSLASSSFGVSGGSLNLTVRFLLVTYFVTFTESGLPSGTNWSLTVGGDQYFSTTNAIVLSEPNGTYTYTAGGVPGWTTSAFGGSVIVIGTATSIPIAWTRVTYSIMFTETGLSTGTNWSVTLNGVQHYSTGSAINFTEPNGTYSFSIGNVTFHTASPSSGSISIAGANVVQTISFSRSFRGSPFFIIIVVAVIAAIAVVVIALLVRRKRGKAQSGQHDKKLIDESLVYASHPSPANVPPPTPSPAVEPPKPGP